MQVCLSAISVDSQQTNPTLLRCRPVCSDSEPFVCMGRCGGSSTQIFEVRIMIDVKAITPAPLPDLSGFGLDAPAYSDLRDRIEAKIARVGIIGLGYVGLPLAQAFSKRGIAVLGFDVDPSKVVKLQRGESYIGHITDDAIH